MSENIQPFKSQMARCRERSGLSYRALESVTGIKHSALAAMQTGNRPVGEQSARRIASAFKLSGQPLEAFVLAAISTSREKVLAAVKDYPAEILNCLALLLLAHGIKPKQITGCALAISAASDRQSLVRLSLRGGHTAQLHVSLTLGA